MRDRTIFGQLVGWRRMVEEPSDDRRDRLPRSTAQPPSHRPWRAQPPGRPCRRPSRPAAAARPAPDGASARCCATTPPIEPPTRTIVVEPARLEIAPQPRRQAPPSCSARAHRRSPRSPEDRRASAGTPCAARRSSVGAQYAEDWQKPWMQTTVGPRPARSMTFTSASALLLQVARLIGGSRQRLLRLDTAQQRVLDLLLGEAIPFAVPGRADVLARARRRRPAGCSTSRS